MGVWAVSLLTDQLSPTSLTTRLYLLLYSEFGWLRQLASPRTIQCSTPRQKYGGRYTKIYFGENQLSPGSFGMLPLTSSHPNLLLQIRVRASDRLSSTITLPKVSSPGFGSIPVC